MALDFATTDAGVIHGSGAAIDNLSKQTFVAWIKPTTLGVNRYVWSKFNTKPFFRVTDSSGHLRLLKDRTTNDLDYTTSTTVSAGAWQFVAYTIDQAAGSSLAHIYTGDLSTAPTEASYSSTTDGSGSFASDSGNAAYAGNRSNSDRSLRGHIGALALFDRVLTLGELTSWWMQPQGTPGCVLSANYFTTTTLADGSGNGFNGILTGFNKATHADHVPLGPAYGLDAWSSRKVAAAPSGGPSIPVIMRHFQRRRAG